MAAVITTENDPFVDGLGNSSQLGVAFLRKVSIDFDDGTDVTATITPEDIQCGGFYDVQSIVMKSAGSAYISALSQSSLTVTASADTVVCDVYVLVRGH